MTMKKIMFNDKYGLTKAVLEGRKTQTRRVINLTDTDKEYLDTAFDWDLRESVIIDRYAKYKVGEVVAVAQNYYDVLNELVGFDGEGDAGEVGDIPIDNIGFRNKMFVKAELMLHHIRITNIRVERLQDIPDEDCFKEGIYEFRDVYSFKNYENNEWDHHSNPFGAYAALIDKVSGKGTWDSNPYVLAYDYEKVD